MEFDWNSPPFEFDGAVNQQDVEESFEDPFAVKLMPDTARFGVQARYFNLGRAAAGTGIISIYRTNGKLIRVIQARAFTTEEQFFYQRKVNQMLAQ